MTTTNNNNALQAARAASVAAYAAACEALEIALADRVPGVWQAGLEREIEAASEAARVAFKTYGAASRALSNAAGLSYFSGY